MSGPAQKPAVIVIGAGAAGLMAALAAAREGARVTLLEQLPRPGAKLLASGGGRCNFSNTLSAEAFMGRFGRNGRFMAPALTALGGQALRDLLAALHVPSEASDGFHVYPRSHSAESVQAALWQAARQAGVEFRLGDRVDALAVEQARVSGIASAGGRRRGTSVVLATGGQSYPSLGGGTGGYALARQAGHTVTPLFPALAPLVLEEAWTRRLAGVSLPGTRLRIDLPRQPKAGVTGDVLFTHAGLSGPAALDLSGDVAQCLSREPRVPLRLEQPFGTIEAWLARFETWRREGGQRLVRNHLDTLLPASAARLFCERADIPDDLRAAAFDMPRRRALAALLHSLPLTVTATGGFEHAMVTRGGVSLREVDPATLQSRVTAGLYLAGELLDLDGPCGGFNLQWAFSSGWLAGRQAAAHPSSP